MTMQPEHSSPLSTQQQMLRVIDLKQFDYCPRILYFHTVVPDVRPVTYKMEAGIAEHVSAEKREQRRSLRPYGIARGERRFNVPLQCQSLGLSGEVDMVIETGDEVIPVDYKLAKRAGAHFQLQLMAYASLLATITDKPIHRGFLYLIPKREVVEVRFTNHLRRKLTRTLLAMQDIASKQSVPLPTKKTTRCVDCEFRRFCNDVL